MQNTVHIALISNSCRDFYPTSVKTREPWSFPLIWICRRNPHSAKLCLRSPTLPHDVKSTEAEITLHRCPQICSSTFLPILQSKLSSCTLFEDSGQLRFVSWVVPDDSKKCNAFQNTSDQSPTTERIFRKVVHPLQQRCEDLNYYNLCTTGSSEVDWSL